MKANSIQEILESTAKKISGKTKETYYAGAEGDGGGLTVLSPHAVVLPCVDISIRIEHRDNHKLKLVKQASDFLVMAIA
jgi:hypothetical protein